MGVEIDGFQVPSTDMQMFFLTVLRGSEHFVGGDGIERGETVEQDRLDVHGRSFGIALSDASKSTCCRSGRTVA
ncbi:hypothetical protein GCM10017668_19250 [Streptomyces tuirus]|uniref:Uncharacterized protein n=1 Tax=Streptomyces tuirus TaxID=68278 RepID=A0A7G1ND28_9ACTN|nr:hypothetical protein GCM10017668_19250 [Streptomyces tuirus]